jgi:hypothetical protein
MQKTPILSISLIFILSSCSALQLNNNKRKMVNEGAKGKTRSKWVAKSQYDALLEKYNELKESHDRLKEEKLTAQHNLLDELNSKTRISKQPDQLKAQAAMPVIIEENVDVDLVNKDVSNYIRAKKLHQQGQLDSALKVFQGLERSGNAQLRVRAKNQTGIIFMKMNKFDLALQVFEDIITAQAFSGVVLDSLKNAQVCAARLGLKEKELRYQSILEDFFGLKA